MINLNAKTAVTLAPHLKNSATRSNVDWDDYILILPNFELYRMWISHSGTPSQVVTTDVISIKGLPEDAKLLGEFFTRMASETSTDQRDGIFLPKSAVHLLGTSTFEQVLKENNFFLTSVVTISMNMEYNAWFAVIDASNTSVSELVLPWFLHLKSVTRSKSIIVTTKSNLLAARAWIDVNLESMICKSIPPDIAPLPSYLLPHQLDKSVYMVMSHSNANILKQQFSLAPNATTMDTMNNCPPCK